MKVSDSLKLVGYKTQQISGSAAAHTISGVQKVAEVTVDVVTAPVDITREALIVRADTKAVRQNFPGLTKDQAKNVAKSLRTFTKLMTERDPFARVPQGDAVDLPAPVAVIEAQCQEA